MAEAARAAVDQDRDLARVLQAERAGGVRLEDLLDPLNLEAVVAGPERAESIAAA